jgi:pimeloyl-ACP methyl ester carboxylesterase
MSELYYLDQGAGVPVVLLHGFPVDARVWRYQIDALSNHHRVIAIDLPGFGRSPSDAPFTIDSLAADVHTLLKKINVLPCVIGGLSMGGYVALAFYQHFASDVLGLMLIDTRAVGDSPENKRNRDKLIEQVGQCGPCPVVDAMMPKVLADETVAAQPTIVAEVRQMMESCPPETMRRALAAMRDRHDRTELLPSIAEPVLIIVGQCDPITPPADAEQMRQSIPHATLAIISDAAHFSPLENPQSVNDAMRNFLAQFR